MGPKSISSKIKPPLIKRYFCHPSPTDNKTLPKLYSIPFEDTTHSLIFIVDYFVVTCKLVKSRFCKKDVKFLRNYHYRFVLCSNGQIYVGDFAKFCGLLRIYEFYKYEPLDQPLTIPKQIQLTFAK